MRLVLAGKDAGRTSFHNALQRLIDPVRDRMRNSCIARPIEATGREASPAMENVQNLLVFQEVVDAGQTAEPALPAVLEAAFLELDLHAGPIVDADMARFEPPGDADRPVSVTGPDAGVQAVVAVVGHGDRLVLGIENLQRLHRSEDLIAGDRQARGRDFEQRLPVQIRIVPDQPLAPLLRVGMSVETTIQTGLADVVGQQLSEARHDETPNGPAIAVATSGKGPAS